MSNNTSVGRGPASGGNENHDGDPRNTTFGENVGQEPPAGNDLIDEAGVGSPSGVPGAEPKPDFPDEAGRAYPDGPNVEASPWELEAARGQLPPRG